MNGITDSMNGKLKIFKSYDEKELEKQVNDYIISFKKEHGVNEVFYDIDFKVAVVVPYGNVHGNIIHYAFVILSTYTGVECDDTGSCECENCKSL